MSMMGELKRRGVIRVGLAYLAASWLLIQVADTVLPRLGFSDTAVTNVIVLLAIGLVPVLILAWVFEWTPEGMRRDTGARTTGQAAPINKRLDRIIIVTLVLAVGYFAVDKFIFDPSRDAALLDRAQQEGRAAAYTDAYGEKSIAVLPFDNLSSDPEQGFFADGISEELLNLLAKVEGLRVISRTSAFSFKGSNEDLRSIAAKLDVAHILEGSVRRSGDRIRITAQLIDARNDVHLWSETYDRTLEDVFAIQDEVAAHVVEELKLRLALGAPQAARVNVQAYTLYLQAQQIMAAPNEFELQAARQLLEEALRIDPGYVDAMVDLSVVHWHLARLAHRDGDKQEEIAQSALNDRLLLQAQETDPDHVSVKNMLGWRALLRDSDMGSAARYFTEALQTDPRNVDVLGGALQLFLALGKLDLAVRVGEYIARREPLDYWAQAHFADALLKNGDIEKAVARMRIAVAVGPDVEAARWKLGLALLVSGDAAGALEQFELEDPKHAYGLHGRALALFDLGRIEEHQAAMAELESASADWPYGLARAYAWIGDADKAFHYLNLSHEPGNAPLRGDTKNPIFAKITRDPRWLPFVESVGQTPEQLAPIPFSPRLPTELLVPTT